MKKIISFILSFFLLINTSLISFSQGHLDISNTQHNLTIHASDFEKNQPTLLQIISDKGRVYVDQQMADSYGNASFKVFLEKDGHYAIKVNDVEDSLLLKHQTKITYADKLKSMTNELVAGMTKGDLTFRQVQALSLHKEVVDQKRIIYSDNNEVSDIVGNIIAKYASGQGVEKETKLLKDALTPEGYFKIGQHYKKINQTIWAIIALDYVKSDYNSSASIDLILSAVDQEGKIENPDITAMALLALANHKDTEKVQTVINRFISYLEKNKEAIIHSKNTCTIATVIQGLLAVEENPFADKWTVKTNNLVNSLIDTYKKDGFQGQLEKEQGLLALLDLQSTQSMYSPSIFDIKLLNRDYVIFKTPSTGEDGGHSGSGDTDKKKNPSSLTIKGPTGSYISNYKIPVDESRDLLTVVLEVLKKNNISYVLSNGGKYIAEINGVGEFSDGANSGWMYRVNGTLPNKGLSNTSVQPNMTYLLFYTEDYTTEKKHSSSKGKSNKNIKKPAEKQLTTQYKKEYAALKGSKVDQGALVDAIDNVRDKVYGRALKVTTADGAKSLVKDAKDAINLMDYAIDKIETSQTAEKTLMYAKDISTSLSKSAELIQNNDLEAYDQLVDSTSVLVKNASRLGYAYAKEDGYQTISQQEIQEISENVKTIKAVLPHQHQVKLDNELIDVLTEVANNRCKLSKNTRHQGSIVVFDEESIQALGDILEETAQLSTAIIDTVGIESKKTVAPTVTLEIKTDNDAEAIAYIDRSSINDLTKKSTAQFKVSSPLGEVTLPETIQAPLSKQQLKVRFNKVDKKDVAPVDQVLKNDSQIIDVDLTVNKLPLKTFEKPISLSIPYSAGQDLQDELVVYHLLEDGTSEKIFGEYDPTKKMVTFKTAHLSKFFVKPEKTAYDDVAKDKWSKSAIDHLSAYGIIKGKEPYYFMPEEQVTRAEFATMLSRLMAVMPQNKTGGIQKKAFNDIQEKEWYSESVKTVCKNGWMQGKGQNRFDPNGFITQQEIACVISKIMIENGYELPSSIYDGDSETAEWAKPSVLLLEETGINNKLANGGFKSTKKATREELAVLLEAFAEKIVLQ